MTSERRKSVIILIATLLLGLVLGLLVPAVFHKIYIRNRINTQVDNAGPLHKKEWFVGTIHRIVQPDSMQAEKIKPITEWAATQIDSIEYSANQHMSAVLDSVKIQLKPILTDEQQSRLDEFDARAKGNWNREGRHRGRHGM